VSPGDVIRWDNFSLQKGPGEDKARWFVFLGDNGRFEVPAVLFALTATTQLHYYEARGARAGRKVVYFEPSPASPFEGKCLIDVENDHYELNPLSLKEMDADIEAKGCISHEKLLEIWRIIAVSSRYSRRIKEDIRRCLEESGIRGL